MLIDPTVHRDTVCEIVAVDQLCKNLIFRV